MTASELVKEYPQSPVFKHIYAYITKNVLPPDRETQRIVTANAEHYVVANGILFRLVKSKKAFDSLTKCLLAVPEKFENTVFHMFHDTLLGAHYGPINTYYTLKDTGCIICLRNLRDTFLHVMHANNKSRKEVRQNFFILEYHSVTTQ